ncbi:hypothetical protein DMENIID0001_028950 [Sergentomyia squamirostris]
MGNLCCAGWKEDEDEGFCLTSTVPSAPITEELLVSGQCKKIDVPVVTEGPLENFVDCSEFLREAGVFFVDEEHADEFFFCDPRLEETASSVYSSDEEKSVASDRFPFGISLFHFPFGSDSLSYSSIESFKSLPIGLGGTFTKPIDIDQIDSVHEKTFTEPIPLVPRETISIPINTQKTSCKGQSNLNSSTKQSDPN